MLPSYSAVPPSTEPIGDRSGTASDSDESEYEEVEIEEEIEVEEEVTGDEEEEELSLSIDDRYDEKRNITVICNNMKSSQCDGGIMIAEITNPVNESSTQVNAFDKVQHFDTKTSQVNTNNVNDAQQMESRCIYLSSYKSVSEGTRSDFAISATDSLINDTDKDNPPVNAVDLMHDQGDGGITNCTQINTYDKALHSNGQTTQVNRNSVNHAQQTESRFAMEITNEDIGPCNMGTCCKFRNINETTKGLLKKRKADTDKLTGQSLSKTRKNRSIDRNRVFPDSGLTSGDGAGPDPLTKDEVCYQIRSSQQVTRTRVSDRAGCLMGQAMGSVSELIKCYDKKVKTEKRLRERIKRYREKKLRNVKRLKKLKRDVSLMSEKEKETLRLMAEKEAEHKKEVCDLMEKLEKTYRENVQLQRENVGIASSRERDRDR